MKDFSSFLLLAWFVKIGLTSEERGKVGEFG
jgi:hypothetical protein